MICVCLSPGVIYYTVVGPASLTVSIYTGGFFSNNKNVMLHYVALSLLHRAMKCLTI